MAVRSAINPEAPIATSVWAGTHDAGVWLFESGNWQHRSLGLGAGRVISLALDPFDHDVLLAVVEGQVYRTDDAALTWNAVSMPYTQTGWNKIFWDRASPGEVVISGPDLGEIFDTDPRAAISRDSGLTWTGIDLPVKDIAKATAGDVWGLDGTWYITADDYNNIVLGWVCHRKVIWKSTDQGRTWQRLCNLNRNKWYTGVKLTALWGDPNHLYAALDHLVNNPLVESTDGGGSWTESTQFFNSPRLFLTDPVDEGTLWLVAQSTLFKSSTGVSGFQGVLSPGSTLTAAVDGYQGVVFGAGYNRFFSYSSDGGDSWTRADLPNQAPANLGTDILSLAAEMPSLLPLSENALWCKGVGDCDFASASAEATGIEGGPINTRTGGVDYTAHDLSMATSAGPLSFFRTYASLSTDFYTNTLGYGWSHNNDIRLIFPEDPDGIEGVVLFKAHTANRYEFLIKDEGQYRAYPGLTGELVRNDGPPVTYSVTDKAQRTYTFDENGVLLTWLDPNGHTFIYGYNLNGLLQQVIDDSGSRWLDFTYDGDQRLQSVQDHSGRELTFNYDLAGDLVSSRDALGQIWTYSYDTDHNLTEVIDPRGVTVERNEFDVQGRAVRQFNGEGELVVELIYNPDGTTTVVDALGNSRVHTYDNRNTLVGETDALGATLEKTYDGNYRPMILTDPGGSTSYLDWDGSGANLTSVIDADGQITRLGYDERNNLTRVEDALGNTSTYTYDDSLLTTSTDALGNITTYTYTDSDPGPAGLLESVTDPLGNTTMYTYNEFGNRASMTDALGNSTLYRYDDRGQLIEVEDALSQITRTEYDDAGRLIRAVQTYDPRPIPK